MKKDKNKTEETPITQIILNANDVLFILQRVTGMRWEWVWGNADILGTEGSWQLMPCSNENDFWMWHLVYSRQWFNDAYDAMISMIDSWYTFTFRREAAG